MKGETKPHDMRIEVPELQGRGILWKRTQVDLEEVNGKLPVDVVELVKIFRFIGIIRADLFQAVAVIRAVLIDAFVNDEELPAFDRHQGITTEGTAENHVSFDGIGIREETVTADLAEELTFIAVVLVEVDHRGTAARTADVLRDIAGRTTNDGCKFLAIFPTIVPKEIFPLPVLRSGTDITDDWRLIHPEFLVFRRMGIIEGPLLKRDISADKRD